MKVYGWMGWLPGDFPRPAHDRHRRQARCIVAARSKAEVARICDEPNASERYFLCLEATGNAVEIAVASASPGTVFLKDAFNYTPGENVYVEHPGYPKTKP